MRGLVSYLVCCWVLTGAGCMNDMQRKGIIDCVSQLLELVFVQDTSASVSEESFDMAKDFIAKTIRQLPVGPDSIRVSLVRYGSDADVIAHLANSSDTETVIDILNRMEYKIGDTDTALALRTVQNQVLSEARPDARSVVIVITDGVSNSPRKTRRDAKKLRDDQVRLVWLYIMGEGQADLERERRTMDKAGDATLKVDRFDDLNNHTIWKILNASCEALTPDLAATTEESATTTEESATTTEESATTTEESATTTEESATTTEQSTTTTKESKPTFASTVPTTDVSAADTSSAPHEGKKEGYDGSWWNSLPKVVGTVVGIFAVVAVTTCLVLVAWRRRRDTKRN